MSLLSPAELYHAELRQQLGLVGRAVALQRSLAWLSRALVAGLLLDFGLITWDWTHGTSFSTQAILLIGIPGGLSLVTIIAAMLMRPSAAELARRVDRVAALHERSLTALELGARRDEHPLALAQMHDAVEHLRRLDTFRAFAPPLPRRELAAGFFLVAASASLALSPNPWLARAHAAGTPAEMVAVDQAQKLDRLANDLQDPNSRDVNQLRDALNQGASSVQASSSQPDDALQALQTLQDQISSMSAGDKQFASGMSAAANALQNLPQTQALANAMDSGDPRQTAQALRDLAQQVGQMTPEQQAQLAQALSQAADQTRNVSQSTADQLSAAAQAMSSPDSASQALDQLSSSASAAAERQRATDQVQSSASALARAMGQVPPGSLQPSGQSQTGTSGQNGQSNQSGQSGQNGQPGQSPQNGQDGADSSQADTSGQSTSGDQSGQGDSGNANGQGDQNGQNGQNGDSGNGSGYSTGSSQPQVGAASQMDQPNGHVEQVPNSNQAQPDQTGVNPNLSPASNGSSNVGPQAVSPSYSSASTQGGGSQEIPQGLQDLVRDYFNSDPSAAQANAAASDAQSSSGTSTDQQAPQTPQN